jgi:hypothetical protein
MEIDQEHLFVDRNLGRKKALDDLKRDLQTCGSGGPVVEKSPAIFGILQAVAVSILVVCVLDLVAGGGWKTLTPALVRDLVMILAAALLLAGIRLLQRRFQNKGH